MILLDSSIWVALFNTVDSQHTKALEVFDAIHEEVIIPEYVFIEVCSVLLLRANRKITNSFIDMVKENSSCRILYSDKYFFSCVLSLFESRKDTSLSFIDTSLLLLAQRYTVITFDKKLHNAIKKV
jgi:predicted nucleic acid-binding protein